MKIRTTARWLLLSTSVLTVSCDKDISVGENEGHSEQKADAGMNHGAHQGAGSIAADAASGGVGTARASQTNPASSGSGGSTGTTAPSTGGSAPIGSGGAAVLPLADASPPAGSCDEGTIAGVDIVSDQWMLQPGEEQINCVQKTFTDDLDIIGLNLESPNAVSVKLSIASGEDAGPDGRVACGGTSGSVVFSMGAPSKNDGNLSGALMFPAGNAIHIARGQRLVLETDVVDTSAQPVSGVSLVQAVINDEPQALSPQPLPVTLRTDCSSPSQLLIQTHWSQQPGTEAYLCTRKTLTSSYEFSTIRVDTSVGTHDYVLSVGPVTGPDGDTGCNASTPDQARLLVTSIDGKSATYPAPAAAHANPGEQALLKLHLFNASALPITGTTSAHVQ